MGGDLLGEGTYDEAERTFTDYRDCSENDSVCLVKMARVLVTSFISPQTNKNTAPVR